MPPLPLLVFVVGMGSLGAEIAAVRLLAPYFGASTVVWANTIGSCWSRCRSATGSAAAGPTASRPCAASACSRSRAAGLLALVPFVGRPLLDLAVDALDAISAGAFLGSLVGVLVLVAVPVLLLGAVSPWAMRLAMYDVEDAGTVAGRLYALSTAGQPGRHAALARSLFIPLVGHAPDVPGLRPADRARRRPRAAAAAALRARAGRDRGADRAAGRDAQGADRQRAR